MKKYADLIKILEELFGKGAVSRTIGTRTNVVRFPKGKQGLDPTKSEFDIEGSYAKNPDLAQIIENSIEDRMGDITQMNDQELLTYTANARRLLNFKKPPQLPEADIVKFGSGEEIKGKGLETLIEKQGTRFPPTTDIGRLEAAGKRLEKFAEEMSPEFLAKQEAERRALLARQYEGKGFAGGVFGPSGMYRAVARDFLLDQNAKGKIKLSPDTIKNLEDRNYISGGQPLMYADPIRIMRYHYGDDIFEKIPLDKIPTGARSEIIDVMSKVEAPPIRTEAPKTPGGYLTPGEYRANIEELKKIEESVKRRESRFADMTEEEIRNELQQYGSQRSAFETGLESDFPEEYAKYKGPKKPEPEGKADGGRIGFNKGKKVMSEIDKLIEQLNKKTKGKKSMESVDPKTGEVTVPKKPIRRAEEPTGTTVMDPEPEIVDEKSLPKIQEKIKVKKYDDDIIKAADNIYPNYDDPKIAADQIVDSYAQMKFGLEDQYGLSGKQRMDLYTQAYDYVMDYNRGAIEKTTGKSINISDETFGKALTDFARENDPEGFANVSKYVDRLNELSNFRTGQEIFENYNLETYHYLTSEQISQLLNQLKNPYKVLDKERDLVKMGFTSTNFEGVGIKNLDEINFKVDKKQLETYLEDLYNKKQVGEAQTELFNLQDSGREPNANGGIAGLL